jgi:hypothetical protein
MELTNEQIQQFKELHSSGELDGLSEFEICEIANNVANYFLTLFSIKQRIEKERSVEIPEVLHAFPNLHEMPQGY